MNREHNSATKRSEVLEIRRPLTGTAHDKEPVFDENDPKNFNILFINTSLRVFIAHISGLSGGD